MLMIHGEIFICFCLRIESFRLFFTFSEHDAEAVLHDLANNYVKEEHVELCKRARKLSTLSELAEIPTCTTLLICS